MQQNVIVDGWKLTVTGHAIERFKERFDIKHLLEQMAHDAFSKGSALNSEEQARFIEKGLFKNNYWLSHYRVYNNLIFVYRKDPKCWVLVTVLPYV